VVGLLRWQLCTCQTSPTHVDVFNPAARNSVDNPIDELDAMIAPEIRKGP
jgi:hypothetical protein